MTPNRCRRSSQTSRRHSARRASRRSSPSCSPTTSLTSRPMGSWRPGRRPASCSPRYSSAIRTARTRRRRSRRPTASLGSGSPRAKGSSPEFHLVRDVPFAPSWPHSLPGQKQGPIGSQMKRLRKKRFIFFGNSSFSQNFHLVWELAKRKINFEKA